jgi:hypothetical protein
LVEGDNAEARAILNQMPQHKISHSKRLVYWCATWMPAVFLRRVAKWRLRTSGA